MAANNMIVQNNIAALNVHRNMKLVGGQQMKASERLSSGFKINRASDDAAGLAISEKMRGQIRGLNMASKNVDDAISLVKTAEGGMQGIDDMLHRIRELLDFGSNDTNENNAIGTGDRQKIQDEIDQLVEEIDSMSDRVEFNKKKLIDGSWQDTKEQLRSSQGLVDTLGVEKAQAGANSLSANNAMLRDLVAMNTANAELYGGQKEVLTAGVPTADGAPVEAPASATGVYKTATAAYETAQGNYDVAKSAYDSAKELLTSLIDEAGVSRDFSTWTSGAAASTTISTLASKGKLQAVASAMTAYNAAATTLGLDELNIASLNSAAQALSALTTTNAALGLTTAASTPPTVGTLPTDIGEAMDPNTDVAGSQIEAWNAAQQTFTTAQGVYDAAVTKAKVATADYDASAKAYDNAMVQERIVQVKLDHAGVSLTAATEMDNAGNSKPLHFQVGANGGQSLFMSIGSLKSDTLGIGDGNGNTNINVLEDTGANITATIDVIDQALSYVTTERSKLGAAVNRMEYTQQSLDITSENVSDAEARIRDADMAQEMMNKTKADTLQQVAVAMMSQANQQPQSILQLLG